MTRANETPLPSPVDVPLAVQPEDRALPALPPLPSDRPSPPEKYDPVRDRMRVLLDRVIYLVVICWGSYLQLHQRLDPGFGIFLLLVAGVRPNNILEAVAVAKSSGRAASVVGVLGALHLETVRRFFST